jgi:hypothetical protein
MTGNKTPSAARRRPTSACAKPVEKTLFFAADLDQGTIAGALRSRSEPLRSIYSLRAERPILEKFQKKIRWPV